MINYFKSFQYLNQKDLNSIMPKVGARILNKGEFFIKEGEICQEVAFIKEGILRSYHTTEAGKDYTYSVLFKDSLITATTSYISGTPSVENIQAVTSVSLEVIHKKDLKKLINSNLNILMLEKRIIEEQYVNIEQRLFSFQRDKVVGRYLELLNNQPEYIKQIPLQYLASYLGISVRHLLRIRKEIL